MEGYLFLPAGHGFSWWPAGRPSPHWGCCLELAARTVARHHRQRSDRLAEECSHAPSLIGLGRSPGLAEWQYLGDGQPFAGSSNAVPGPLQHAGTESPALVPSNSASGARTRSRAGALLAPNTILRLVCRLAQGPFDLPGLPRSPLRKHQDPASRPGNAAVWAPRAFWGDPTHTPNGLTGTTPVAASKWLSPRTGHGE